MWFNKLMGFEESKPQVVRENITVEGNKLISKINGQSYQFGSLQIPTLAELKLQAPVLTSFVDKISVSEVVGDVQKMHCQSENEHALFQAASQFNLLEMVGPEISPRAGVDIYENDRTQGPACAIACGAGTIFRNYFVPFNDQRGQTGSKQIDCLELIGAKLNNEKLGLWQMKNGYALPSQNGILQINSILSKLSSSDREELKSNLKLGIQWNTEVTLSEAKHTVSQVYCSALPVAYSQIESFYWESFATLILEATYEATLYAALINLDKNKSNIVFLTLVGGGAFGNNFDWIYDSLLKSIRKFKHAPLDIRIVSYSSSNASLQKLLLEI